MHKFVQFGIFAIALCFSASANGQTTLLEELFDDGTLGVFTEYSVIGDGQTWGSSSFGDDVFAQMNGFDGGIQDNEDWLISPPLDMDAYSDEVLTFLNASNFDGPDMQVMVSTDYDGTSDPNTATWDDRTADVSLSPGDYTFVDSGELDLSSYTGTGYIAFKYVSNLAVQGKLWRVDSLVVRATGTTNIGLVEEQLPLISTPMVQSDQLTFDVLANIQEMDFAIYSVNGQLLDQFTNTVQFGTMQHSVLNLATGIYVLHARTEEGMQAFKFVRN